MNTIIQNIVVFLALGYSLFFLWKKYFAKKKPKKACGTDDCGCR